MVFNKAVFKRLLKEAYRGAGLLVANKDGRIIISGSWWVMTMEEKVFTNDGRAALVELTGQLPVPGECWRSTSSGNQIEIPPEYIDIDSIYPDVTVSPPFEKTIIIMDGLYGGLIRLYQRDKSIVCINEVVDILLDPSQTKEGEDSNILGPYTRNTSEPSMFYWYTDECSFAANKLELDKTEYVQLLTEIAAIEIPRTKW